jgi:hypothetical protein
MIDLESLQLAGTETVGGLSDLHDQQAQLLLVVRRDVLTRSTPL